MVPPVPRSRCPLSLACLLLCLHATPASGQEAGSVADEGADSAPQPQGPPPKLTINDWFTPRYNGVDNTQGNLVVLRAYIPWNLFRVSQLTRLSLPFTTSSPGRGSPDNGLIDDFPSGPTGMGDSELYDVAQFSLQGAQLSLGPVFLVPTGTKSGVGAGKITAGPAWGLKGESGRWTIGVFSLSYRSIGGHSGYPSTAKTKVQPIVDLALRDGWDIGTSDMWFNYDWNRDRYSNIPLGFAVAKSFELFSRRFKVIQQAEYNFATGAHTSAWTLRFSLEIPLPELN